MSNLHTARDFRPDRRLPAGLALALALGLAGCDNVGRAFDRDGGKGGEGTTTQIAAVPKGGFNVEGRPKVRNVFPTGNGWPGTVPIVVVFNETISPDSVQPAKGEPNLFVRQRIPEGTGGEFPGGEGGGASPPLPASYDFLLGGRAVVIRPLTPFDTSKANTFEIVIRSELKDADDIRFGGKAERVLESFTADRADTVTDGRILTVLPVDNARSEVRQLPIHVIFTKPVLTNTVFTSGPGANLKVRPQGGGDLEGSHSFPLRGTAGDDGRVLEFVPKDQLAGSTRYEIVVNDTILFPSNGKLDFRGRTPYAKFDTSAGPPVNSVKVGNATAGAPDKVNRTNIDTLRLDVDLPAETIAGDQIRVRIYGLHRDGGSSGSLDFFEARSDAPVDGAQVVGVDFSGVLGPVDDLKLLEGPLQFAAWLLRGSTSSGYILSNAANNPAIDVTPPELQTPAEDSNGNRFLYTDQEYVAFFGNASENLGAASLVLDSTPPPAPVPTTGVLYGKGIGGRFMFEPILLGRRTAPVGYSLTITDAAGNEASPYTGQIVQRGVVTGSVSGGTLVVEAFDDASFAALSGVTVVIEEGLPTAPPTGRQTQVTGADGRATFTGLTASTHSITLIQAGYHMVSLLDTGAGFVSLPLRPESGATASVTGTAVFSAGAGQSALVGCNIIDDITRTSIATTTTAPTTIPTTAARPNRPYVVTALGGTFGTGAPAITQAGCSICGTVPNQFDAARSGVAAGGTGRTNLALLPTTGTMVDLAASYDKDLADWTGLDTSKLTGPPTVRVLTSLFGLAQQTLTGAGFASQSGATTTYTITASFSAPMAVAMAKLLPKFWVATQASDTDGVVARHRRIILDPTTGTTFAVPLDPAVATITAPGGATTDSPQVTYQDRLDPTAIAGSMAFQVLTATSGSRSWRVIRPDRNAGSGATALQLPVLAGVAVPTLAKGGWKIRAESHLMFSLTMSDDDYLLEEMRREEVTYARTPETTFTVN